MGNFIHSMFDSEWDQPPEDMRPPGSVAIKVLLLGVIPFWLSLLWTLVIFVVVVVVVLGLCH